MSEPFPEGEAQLLISALSSLQSYHPQCAILLEYLFYWLEIVWDSIWFVSVINSAKYMTQTCNKHNAITLFSEGQLWGLYVLSNPIMIIRVYLLLI